MLKMCLNPKVLAGLAAIGVAVYLVAPNLIVAALPLLILAACPLSMLFMGGAMRRGHGEREGAPSAGHADGSMDAPLHTSSEEEVSALKAEVRNLSDRQAALLEEVERLRQANEAERPVTAVEEAEEIARSASSD